MRPPSAYMGDGGSYCEYQESGPSRYHDIGFPRYPSGEPTDGGAPDAGPPCDYAYGGASPGGGPADGD